VPLTCPTITADALRRFVRYTDSLLPISAWGLRLAQHTPEGFLPPTIAPPVKNPVGRKFWTESFRLHR
jgi:hypothetical protein